MGLINERYVDDGQLRGQDDVPLNPPPGEPMPPLPETASPEAKRVNSPCQD